MFVVRVAICQHARSLDSCQRNDLAAVLLPLFGGDALLGAVVCCGVCLKSQLDREGGRVTYLLLPEHKFMARIYVII